MSVNTLTKLQVQFAHLIAVADGRSATKCAIDAGYSEISACESASINLRNPRVLEAIEDRKEQLAAMAGLDPAWVLREWMQIASANPADLVSVRSMSCEFCYDADTRRLLDTPELRESLKTPNPDCAVCGGAGLSDVRITDTRKLKGAARRLYAGAVKTKDGIKILMRDQDAALTNLSLYLGMRLERREIAGPGGGPIALTARPAAELTDDELAALALAAAPPGLLLEASTGE